MEVLPVFLRIVLAVALAVGTQVALPQPTEATWMGCTWTSKTKPPPSIRVLKVGSGKIVKVDFRKYVYQVVAGEWGSPRLMFELQKAGAVASKQYGWYKTLRPRSYNGRCYHVTNTTTDQLYRPSRHTVTARHRRAVDQTWGTTVWKDSKFVFTWYRLGNKVGCAKDVKGHRLFERSAQQCAKAGWGHRRILRVYYDATLR
jgi:peptidoglycan hydrolase-like amidase